MKSNTIKSFLCALLLGVAILAPAAATDIADWGSVKKEARGQTVYFNAWGGAQNINDYILWAADTLKERYDIDLVHVKLDDTAYAVSKVLAEKAAGKNENGSIDLIWINGENFASMKRHGLLLTPGWADRLPNWRYVDYENMPTITSDFTEAVEGLEAPWGMAKLVFFHDTARTADIPHSFAELVAWTQANPGRFTYPAPPDFIGSSFLKQALIETVADPSILQMTADKEVFAVATKPLFEKLDGMHPNLWRAGRTFPKNKEKLRRLLADNEIDIAFAFSPSEASNAIANGELPDTVRSFVFDGGTLGNTHFLTIPYNATAKAGALVTANFLMSPEAQRRKLDPKIWGDPTVLAIDKLDDDDRAAFGELELGIATLKPEALGATLNEPHASWQEMLEAEWIRRYGVAN
jgi:putative thiamine transport system substrate-binding protein